MSVKDIDKGYSKIIRQIGNMDGVVVAVGHFSDSGTTEDGKMNLTTLMATHEYGSKKMSIPSRPVYRTAFADNVKKLHKLAALLYSQVLLGNLTELQVAKKIGMAYEGILKEQFTKRIFKNTKYGTRFSPNYRKRPSGRKVNQNTSTPLFDTGTLRNSIKYRVV